MTQRKWAWSAVLIAAVVLAVVLLINRSDQYIAKPSATPTPTLTPVATAAKPASKKLPVSGTAQQTQAYSELVKQYAGRHIQFDISCQAKPTQTTFKNGTAILFDNRSGDARTIKIGDVTYSFPGYGYKILTLSSPTLPKTLSLSCGAAINVGSILLQR